MPGRITTSAVFDRRRALSLSGRAGRSILLLDNYDSFTQNLAHALASLGADVTVVRHDEVAVRDVVRARPAGVVISPGPLSPREAGISVPLVRACARAKPPIPVLGVCLGHQAIGVAFGGRVVRAKAPVHGRATRVAHRDVGVLRGVRCPTEVARYHSLVVDPTSLPDDLEAHAVSAEGEVMGLLHRRLPIEGLQFHPESFLSPDGPAMLAAFLRRCGIRVPAGRRARRYAGRTRRR